MKKVKIKKSRLLNFENMLLLNNIHEVDPYFIENNSHLYEPTEKQIDDHIEDLAGINWKKEEYKPYGIEDTMTPEEIREHVNLHHWDDLQIDLQCEPMQFYITRLSGWQKEQLESYDYPYGYSELLDCHVIPSYSFGISWEHEEFVKEVEDEYQLASGEEFIG